jgi:hypothetical protein
MFRSEAKACRCTFRYDYHGPPWLLFQLVYPVYTPPDCDSMPTCLGFWSSNICDARTSNHAAHCSRRQTWARRPRSPSNCLPSSCSEFTSPRHGQVTTYSPARDREEKAFLHRVSSKETKGELPGQSGRLHVI